MHYYTSITANYLPKASVLAQSVKNVDRTARFHLLLLDKRPQGWNPDGGLFDSVLGLNDLRLHHAEQWAFKHALVEMCTAAKGPGALEIVRRHNPGKLVFFDPDIVVFGGLDRLSDELERHSILLTPHLTDPEQTEAGVLDNEISALKHGIYNLGFLGFRCEGEGLRCMAWWASRLLEYCRDDIPGGLFTDQRWADHIPAMFEGVRILREPVYNVATWNLSNRKASGESPNSIRINGAALSFFHFSGLDSGAQEVMLGLYGQHSPVLADLRKWYLAQCELFGQHHYGKLPCIYSRFDNGASITKAHRILYRSRSDLQQAFPNPFLTSEVNRSYWHWFEANAHAELRHAETGPCASIRTALENEEIAALRHELDAIKRSRSWKLARAIRRAAAIFR